MFQLLKEKSGSIWLAGVAALRNGLFGNISVLSGVYFVI
jgi:hypothetical protein